MAKKYQIRTEELTKLMIYILGYKPHEFGLVPDVEGFVTLKELLQAIHEESGWGHIRHSHINEVLMSQNRSFFQADDKRIRAIEKYWNLDLDIPAQNLPKILFIGIRKRAHLAVIEDGLRSKSADFHILTSDKAMAIRIGRRRDNQPVLIEVSAELAQKEGTHFFSFGDLFLTKDIQARYIAGPPVPKALIKAKAEKLTKPAEKPYPLEPGTFILDQGRDMDLSRREKGKKKKGWKEKARKTRRKRNGYTGKP